jgi:hypothetical protein
MPTQFRGQGLIEKEILHSLELSVSMLVRRIAESRNPKLVKKLLLMGVEEEGANLLGKCIRFQKPS